MNYVLYLHDPDNTLIPELSVEIAQKRMNRLLELMGWLKVTVDLVPECKRIVELENELEEFENMDEEDE